MGQMQEEEPSALLTATIRRARNDEAQEISNLVNEAVVEKYGHLFEAPPPLADHATGWMGSWIAETGNVIVGVGLATRDHIDDLWLRRPYRRRGIGAMLLASLERQITESGHAAAHLRVVGENTGALRFYQKHGWRIVRRFPHERWRFQMVAIEMVAMVKNLQA